MQEKFAICLQIFWKVVFSVRTNPYLITKILHTSLYMSSTFRPYFPALSPCALGPYGSTRGRERIVAVKVSGFFWGTDTLKFAIDKLILPS